jgi:hypothetical protein
MDGSEPDQARSTKRERIPDVLELAEIQLLLSKLGVGERTIALLDYS